MYGQVPTHVGASGGQKTVSQPPKLVVSCKVRVGKQAQVCASAGEVGRSNQRTVPLAPELQIVTDFIDLLIEGQMIFFFGINCLSRNDLNEAAQKQKSARQVRPCSKSGLYSLTGANRSATPFTQPDTFKLGAGLSFSTASTCLSGPFFLFTFLFFDKTFS